MSQNRTVARPYAKAVFELAQEHGAFSIWSDMLACAAFIAADKRVIDLMKDPKFSPLDAVSFFKELGEGQFLAEMVNFIRVLAQAKRLSTLPEIAEIYEEMRQQAEAVVTVEFICAFPISEDTRQRFLQLLKARMHCDIVLECRTDETILGGAIIRAGDLVIDGSGRGRLAKLSDAMGLF